jgi:hypothetical protein
MNCWYELLGYYERRGAAHTPRSTDGMRSWIGKSRRYYMGAMIIVSAIGRDFRDESNVPVLGKSKAIGAIRRP